MSFEGFSMTTRLTFPASMFSVVCQRCGSTLRKNADSCPNCGADRDAAFGEERKKERAPERVGERLSLFKPAGEPAAEPAVEPAAPVTGPSDIAPVAASLPVRSATSAELGFELGPDPDVLPDSEGWTRRKTVIAGVCAFALIAGGVAYMQHDNSDEDPAPSEQHSASGAIDAKDAKSGGYAQSGSLPVTPAAPPVAAVERKPQVDERPMSVADTVLAARSAMEQHDLTAARNRVKSLTPPQQARPDVQRLKDELAQRELERDAALQLARACEKTSAWACVQQNAGEALALDGSNTESQAMLERVIAHAGWLAGTPPLAKRKLAPDIASVAPPVVTTPQAAPPVPAPAVQAATPPAKVAVAKPAPAPVVAPAPAPAPVTVQQKPAVAVAHAPAATPAQTHTATAAPPPARESRRSATYARNTQTPTPATSTAKVTPAPAIAPPVQPATPPVTASVRSTTTPLVTTTTAVAPSPAPATLPAATTPPVTTATARSTTPAPAPAPSYAAVPPPTPAVTRTAPAAATTTTTPPPATVTRTAAATYGASGATETRPATRASLSDGTNPDELERAIKQFGWSGGDTMPKPSR